MFEPELIENLESPTNDSLKDRTCFIVSSACVWMFGRELAVMDFGIGLSIGVYSVSESYQVTTRQRIIINVLVAVFWAILSEKHM